MKFFSQKKLQSRKIEVDENTICCDSPLVRQRLDRIDENYQRLDLILSDVENKIRNDERLNAIDETITEIEIEVDGRKKKWRPRRPKKKKPSARKSVDPKKPR